MSTPVGIHLGVLSWYVMCLRHGQPPDITFDLARVIVFEMTVASLVYGTDRGASLRQTVPSGLATVGLLLSEPSTSMLFPIVLLCSTGYKWFKPRLGWTKPAFVATMWILACVTVPVAFESHSLFQHVDVWIWGHIWCNLFAISNMLDIPDIEEDQDTGVRTLAISLGSRNAETVSQAALCASTLIALQHPSSATLVFSLQNTFVQHLIRTGQLHRVIKRNKASFDIRSSHVRRTHVSRFRVLTNRHVSLIRTL